MSSQQRHDFFDTRYGEIIDEYVTEAGVAAAMRWFTESPQRADPGPAIAPLRRWGETCADRLEDWLHLQWRQAADGPDARTDLAVLYRATAELERLHLGPHPQFASLFAPICQKIAAAAVPYVDASGWPGLRQPVAASRIVDAVQQLGDRAGQVMAEVLHGQIRDAADGEQETVTIQEMVLGLLDVLPLRSWAGSFFISFCRQLREFAPATDPAHLIMFTDMSLTWYGPYQAPVLRRWGRWAGELITEHLQKQISAGTLTRQDRQAVYAASDRLRAAMSDDLTMTGPFLHPICSRLVMHLTSCQDMCDARDIAATEGAGSLETLHAWGHIVGEAVARDCQSVADTLPRPAEGSAPGTVDLSRLNRMLSPLSDDVTEVRRRCVIAESPPGDWWALLSLLSPLCCWLDRMLTLYGMATPPDGRTPPPRPQRYIQDSWIRLPVDEWRRRMGQSVTVSSCLPWLHVVAPGGDVTLAGIAGPPARVVEAWRLDAARWPMGHILLEITDEQGYPRLIRVATDPHGRDALHNQVLTPAAITPTPASPGVPLAGGWLQWDADRGMWSRERASGPPPTATSPRSPGPSSTRAVEQQRRRIELRQGTDAAADDADVRLS